ARVPTPFLAALFGCVSEGSVSCSPVVCSPLCGGPSRPIWQGSSPLIPLPPGPIVLSGLGDALQTSPRKMGEIEGQSFIPRLARELYHSVVGFLLRIPRLSHRSPSLSRRSPFVLKPGCVPLSRWSLWFRLLPPSISSRQLHLGKLTMLVRSPPLGSAALSCRIVATSLARPRPYYVVARGSAYSRFGHVRRLRLGPSFSAD
ncbi:unnamed protein product, partial [Dovyalis caffra]